MHRAPAAVALEAEREDRDIARDLNARLDDFKAVDVDLSTNLVVHGAQGSDAVEPALDKWIEVGEAGCRDLEKTARIAMAPAFERGALQFYDRLSDVQPGCSHRYNSIRPRAKGQTGLPGGPGVC